MRDCFAALLGDGHLCWVIVLLHPPPRPPHVLLRAYDSSRFFIFCIIVAQIGWLLCCALATCTCTRVAVPVQDGVHFVLCVLFFCFCILTSFVSGFGVERVASKSALCHGAMEREWPAKDTVCCDVSLFSFFTFKRRWCGLLFAGRISTVCIIP